MKKQTFVESSTVPVTLDRLWEWHMSPGAFERLMPPWQTVEPLDLPEVPGEGQRAVFNIRTGPLKKRWEALLGPVEPPHRFVDTQERGPFAAWRHEHRMRATGENEAVLSDEVEFSLPVGLGTIPLFRNLAGKELERLFRFRHRRMTEDLGRFPETLPGKGRTVLVTGSRGFIGQRLVPYLRTLGYTVRGLSRSRPGEGTYLWDPAGGEVDPEALDGVDGVIHLAGEGIASGRWTAERRRRILESRREGTRTLVKAMARTTPAPKVLVSASGVNFYAGREGTQEEGAPLGEGFLAEVCDVWEGEARVAEESGIRTVLVRTGVVLDPSGGALGKMLPAFKAGLGGPIGNGRQGFPWIAMDDLLDIYERGLRDPDLTGPVNAVHPEPISQGSFSRSLGHVLGRPAILPLPASMVKLLFGRMGEETLLADLDIRPGVLVEKKHAFRSRSVQDALGFLLGKTPAE
ncbi:MAG: TIGR01777 family oxidoreductase [Oceanipulchritudo sp.]